MPTRTNAKRFERPEAQAEFGDFQTPATLAESVVKQVARDTFHPQSIVEPTCGRGHLLLAARNAFPSASQLWGVEINPIHLGAASAAMQAMGTQPPIVKLIEADAFQFDWQAELSAAPGPLLILGNPPWVTNASQGVHGSDNLPEKHNRPGVRGIEALTGSSNFDVAESILMRMLDVLEQRGGRLAMLCKTSVARRVLKSCWHQHRPFDRYQMLAIDSQLHFGASVDACLFIVAHEGNTASQACELGQLGEESPGSTIGWRAGRVVGNLSDYDDSTSFYGDSRYRWRSGIKHDCAPVFELSLRAGVLTNGLNEVVDVERDLLFPLMKGGPLLKGLEATSKRWLLVTQQHLGDDTRQLEATAPKAWRYLQRHRARLDARASRVYRSRSPFAMFGIGGYTFAPWKVAISGFAKRPEFQLLSPVEGRPVVCDDTCYFLGFETQSEAEQACAAFNEPAVRRALAALMFPTAKRPVTAQILNQINPETRESTPTLSAAEDPVEDRRETARGQGP